MEISIHLGAAIKPGAFRITVADNGKGIPKNILSLIGSPGYSFEKSQGHGLGLAFAKQFTTRHEGDFQIHSKLGVGTQVYLELPSVHPPPWFLDKIPLQPGSTLVILDDDESIHQVWKGRLNSWPQFSESNINLVSLYSASQGREFFESKEEGHLTLLFDYELRGESANGLDLLVRSQVTGLKILVTSRSFEDAIQRRCLENGIKLLPKNLAPYISFEVDAVGP